MAPGKKAELDATLENLRDEVNKIGVVERSMEDLKESVMEIRNRMSVMERLEKRLDETEETRKREFATLFQTTLQSHMEEEISPPIRRSGKQIATEEEGSGLFRAGTSRVRSESVTRVGEARRETPKYIPADSTGWSGGGVAIVIKLSQFLELKTEKKVYYVSCAHA
ncbi:hypothetical protein DY000_02020332 [Brassica cretica]|uniref:Uncharacterized protein n=1 Tax=Brassica cretica TaxID=69181 RepID=A0ABQ7E9G9_BRACR|nr:hypothetical protein DY000_02020332 [Brassica cretica]